MKKNIIPTILVCSLIFSFFNAHSLLAQAISKTYAKEITATENGTVQLVGKTLKFQMNGIIHSMCGEEGYVIKTKKNEPPILTIANLKVETWDKPIVKQNITIKVTPTEGGKKVAEELLHNLQLDLSENNQGIISANNNLNIKRFEMINGIFRRDRTTIVLENEQAYNIKKLEIFSTLSIPKNHNLEVKLESMNLEIEDLDGFLKISGASCDLKAGKLKNLEANLMFGQLNVSEVNKATINAHISTIKINKVEELILGSTQIGIEQAIGGLFNNHLKKLSSQNTYIIDEVKSLKIQESTSDLFQLNKVGSIESLYSFFSDYKINSLSQSLHLKSKNGDLFIKEIQNDFEKIDIFNDVSTIHLGINKLENCILELQKNQAVEFKVPTDFKAMENDIFGSQTLLKGNKKDAGKVIIRCYQCDVLFN